MTPPPLEIGHRCRISALESERAWSLRGDVLWVGVEGQAEVPVPLASLKKMRLAYAPTRFQTGRYQCHLYGPNARVGTIQNEHYAGIAKFEDRSESCQELVRAMLRRTAGVRPDCRLEGGTSWANWLAQTAFLGLSLAFLLFVLISLWSAIGWLVIVKLVVLIWLLPERKRI